MAETHHPLLLLPTPTNVSKAPRPGGRTSKYREHEWQIQRISPQFKTLQGVFENMRTTLGDTPAGIDPEMVVVIEVDSQVEFLAAVRGIQGLEWLGDGEIARDIEEEDVDWTGKIEGGILRGRLFLSMTNQRALSEIISLWERHEKSPEDKFAHGLGAWKTIFRAVHNIRTWNARDRLEESNLLEDWERRETDGEEIFPVQIELWYRADQGRRNTTERTIGELVKECGGTMVQRVQIDDIRYHAMLAKLPVSAIKLILQNNHNGVRLIQCHEVMFFHPTGQSVSTPLEGEGIKGERAQLPLPKGDPVVALLDGLPTEAHELLKDRLVLDDPDAFTQNYEVQWRVHGTSMASLMIHGDLSAQGNNPLKTPLYVRPILKLGRKDIHNKRHENFPEDLLMVDLLYRAFRRMFVGGEGEAPTAPHVRIVNLSVGDPSRPFNRLLSPLACLLDWAAWEYKILICVSAGNDPRSIELARHPSIDKEQQKPLFGEAQRETSSEKKQREIKTLKKLHEKQRHRKLLSPAESINALTIGASHNDASSASNHGRLVDLLRPDMPSSISRIGSGFKRAIKPDILMPGGRQLYQQQPTNDWKFSPSNSTHEPGIQSAYPWNKTMFSCGTSNASALASRAAMQCLEVIESLRVTSPLGTGIGREHLAPLLKAMLVHGAVWPPDVFGVFEEAIKPIVGGRALKQVVGQYLGYGLATPERVMHCTEERATTIGYGTLSAEGAHMFKFPLPADLSARAAWRRLTITLAWLTPLNFAHQKYRRAALWFDPPETELDVGRHNAEWRAVKRGTVQHEILEGKKAAVFNDGDTLAIQVNCAKDAGALGDPIPYALLISLEVKEGVGIPIYQQVKDKIPVRVQA